MIISHDMPTAQPLAPQIQTIVADKVASGSVLGLENVTEDMAHLSEAASLTSQASSTSDVRFDKVATVQAAIAGGTYNVPSTDVAQSLVDHMLGKKS